MTPPSHQSAYIARLWEHPDLCVALFGVQYHTREGQDLYEASGIDTEMEKALEEAREQGLLLLNRPLASSDGGLLMQYWRSYDDLDRWARQQPHSRWWRWLREHTGRGLGFYHEVYRARTAEAIYEEGTAPVGPALFCSTEIVEGGKGQSRDRQTHFATVTQQDGDFSGDE
jgi:hypothetical protein